MICANNVLVCSAFRLAQVAVLVHDMPSQAALEIVADEWRGGRHSE